MKLPIKRISRLPKPVKWGVFAIGAYVAFKVALVVLAMVSMLVGIALGIAGIALIAAIAYSLVKR